MTITHKFVDDPAIWETFLAAHSPQSLFQSWLWGEVQKKLGSTVHRWGFYQGGALVGIAQTVFVRARRGAFLHVRHGPVFARQNTSLWVSALAMLKDVARKERAWFVRISPLLFPTRELMETFSLLKLTPSPIHAMDAEYCWVLDIDAPEETLLRNMRKTTRYEIRRAMRLGVTVSKSANPDDLKHFFRLYEETSSRHGFVRHTGITEEFDVFSHEGKEMLFTAAYRDDVIAAAIITMYGNQAIYHHGASQTTNVPASYLIQWEAIREAKKRGLKLYNFWGIAHENKPNHPWRGITLFKKGFGGRSIAYIHAHDLPISPWYMVTKCIESTRRIMRGY